MVINQCCFYFSYPYIYISSMHRKQTNWWCLWGQNRLKYNTSHSFYWKTTILEILLLTESRQILKNIKTITWNHKSDFASRMLFQNLSKFVLYENVNIFLHIHTKLFTLDLTQRISETLLNIFYNFEGNKEKSTLLDFLYWHVITNNIRSL